MGLKTEIKIGNKLKTSTYHVFLLYYKFLNYVG